MKNEKNTLNLNIDTDKLVTFKDYQKDYQKLDNISHKFIELIKPKIVNFVKKQLTETLGLALSKSINSTIANSTPNHGKQLQPVCLKDYDQDNKIDRTIRINKNSQIMPSMAWQCGRMAQDYANKQGITLTELIKNINHIQRDQPDDITISVNNPAKASRQAIFVCQVDAQMRGDHLTGCNTASAIPSSNENLGNTFLIICKAPLISALTSLPLFDWNSPR